MAHTCCFSLCSVVVVQFVRLEIMVFCVWRHPIWIITYSSLFSYNHSPYWKLETTNCRALWPLTAADVHQSSNFIPRKSECYTMLSFQQHWLVYITLLVYTVRTIRALVNDLRVVSCFTKSQQSIFLRRNPYLILLDSNCELRVIVVRCLQ